MTAVIRALVLPRVGWQPRLTAAAIALRAVVPPIWAHAARTVLAAMLAMWLAFELQLDTPYSAATTVLIVAHPVNGMILSKSLYRLGGTVAGVIAAVALMGAFAQAPEMFMLGFSIWMGICAGLSTLLRNFRSYGAVLAGYTVALITMPAATQPEAIFDLAAARLAVVAVGIGCSALVAALLSRRTAEQRLEAALREALIGLCGYCVNALSGAGHDDMAAARRALAARISALDALIEYAALEAAEVAPLSSALRGAVTAMFGALTAASSLHEAAERCAQIPALRELTSQFTSAVDELASAATAGGLDALGAVAARFRQLGSQIEDSIGPSDLPLLVALDRLDEVVDELALCVDGLASLLGRSSAGRIATLRPHLDFRWAASNGLRAAVSVWMAGALWFTTGWPAGGSMVVGVVPLVGLLSLRDRPANDAVGFAWGTVLASVVGFASLVWILPQITDFPLLALTMAPFLFVGVVASTVPRLTFISLGFCVFFITLLGPGNPIHYDPEGFLNNALAIFAGTLLTAAIYRLVLPADLRARKRALILAIRKDLQSLLRSPRQMPRPTWEARMHERLLLLGARLRAAGIESDASVRGGFAALRIGREALRVRELLVQREPLAVAQPALAALGDPSAAPQAVTASCHLAANRLLTLAAELPRTQAASLARAAASFVEIAILVGRHRHFFQRPSKT